MRFSQANGLQRAIRRFASSGPGSWFFARVLHHVDRPVYRLSGERFTLTSLLAGLPMAMLTTTGAKSGEPRTVPVLGLPTPDGLAVISSNYGQRNHPAWYHNLRANPDTTVQVGSERREVHARAARPEERGRLWERAVDTYAGFGDYQQRADREIPLIVLEPR